ATQTVALCTSNPTYVISSIRPVPMHEALCRPSGTTLDIVHAERRAADHSANIGSRGGEGLRCNADGSGKRVITAFGAVLRAVERLDVRRLALGAPYSRETTLQGKAHLEAHGLEVVNLANLQGVTNIYDETAERAYRLARMVDREDAEAVFLSG